MRTKLIIAIITSLLSAIALNSAAEEQRKFYEEPGIHPFKDPIPDLNETIDPFSGTLQLRHTDITVPGNGGVAIEVGRFYLNHQDGQGESPAYSSMYGVGWTMHFGRIVVSENDDDKVCSQYSWNTHTLDNPSLEHPDGSRELLVLSDAPNAYLITKSNWKMDCVNGTKQVTSPDGTVYTMDAYSLVQLAGGHSERAWYTTRIEDIHGNTIVIDYIHHPRGYLLIDKVTGYHPDGIADGRLVSFTYESLDDQDPDACLKLTGVTSNGQLWQYNYEILAGYDPGYVFCGFNLTEVVLPSGQRWQYEYYPRDNVAPGKFSIKKVTYPYGGVFEYTYQHLQLDPGDSHRTTSVATKNTSGPNLTSGTWTYDFAPNSYPVIQNGQNRFADKTTITQPNGKTEYIHQGASLTGDANLWAMGLLLKTSVYSDTDVLLEDVVTAWGKREISRENYWNGDDLDTYTYSPLPLSRTTWRNNGNNLITYSNYDIWGNPGTVVENSNLVGEPDRTTAYTYYTDPASWIIGVKEDETITGVGTIDRAINALGQVVSENNYGVVTSYTYTPEGDPNTVTDARNNTVTTSDYYRGIARLEQHPESVTISRIVNPTGTVASITNGRGLTKSFTYDSINRLTSIDYPANADVAVVYSPSGKTLTRGNYQEAVLLDGFGKEIQVTRTDLSSGESITKTTGFDALAQKIFESYPNSLAGENYTFDAIGRLTRLDHPDGTHRDYAFSSGGTTVTETDERGNSTVIVYRVFGHPDSDKVPQYISTPDEICTHIYYNAINQTTRVFQGDVDPQDPQSCLGYDREFAYDARTYLVSEDHPETGLTLFGRDQVGNMVSRQVGLSEITTFNYDGRNRLTFTDYPGNTPDVTRSYDENDNVRSVDNADSQHGYLYDQNDNLQTEIIDIGANSYTINYSYDLNDIVSSIIYPSGRVIGYAPDAFGRPRAATPYVSAINYYPSGQVQQVNYANGQTLDVALNTRLWVERMYAHGPVDTIDLNYQYDAIGNVDSVTDALDANNNRALGYDGANRLITATGLWGYSLFDYNGRGDIESELRNGTTKLNIYSLPQTLTHILHNSNFYDELIYDVYGNIARIDMHDQSDPINNGVFQQKYFTYDDAGNLRQARIAPHLQIGADYIYGYDGNNMRVSKSTAGVAAAAQAEYVYAKSSNLIGEYEPNVNAIYGKEYFYLGSQQIASAQENQVPVANAGPDAAYYASQAATLDSSTSSDPDSGIVSRNWQQLTGTPVTLSDPTAVNPGFTTPQVSVQGTLTFQLTVTDNDGASDADTVDIQVSPNAAPVANAGGDQTVLAGVSVQLDGSNSSDAEGAVTYQWLQTAGPSVTLSGSTTATPSFVAPANGANYTLGFQLTVTDTLGLTGVDNVSVTVNDPSVDSDADGLADYWEVSNFGSIATYNASGDPDGDGISNAQEYLENTDPTAPASIPLAPIGVTAIAGNSSNTVSWDKGVSVLSYNVYWSTTTGVTPASGTKVANATLPYRHTGLTNGVSYYYVVTAVNNAGESATSNEVTAQPGVLSWGSQTQFIGALPNKTSINNRGDLVELRVSGADLYARYYKNGTGWYGDHKLVVVNQISVSSYVTDINDSGDAVVVWSSYNGSVSRTKYALFDASTGNWTQAANISASGSGVNSAVHLSNSGAAILSYFTTLSTYTRDYSPLLGWQAEHLVGPSTDTAPRLSVSDSGKAALAWGNNNTILWSTRSLGGSWSVPTVVNDPQNSFDSLGYKNIGIDANGNAVVMWLEEVIANNGAYLNIRARNYNATNSQWGTTVLIDKVSLYSDIQLAVSQSGSAIVVWRDSSSGSDILYRHYAANQSWSRSVRVNTRITTRSWLYPTVGMDDSGNAIIVYTEVIPGYYPDGSVRNELYEVRYDASSGVPTSPALLSDASLGNISVSADRLLMNGQGNAIIYFQQYTSQTSGPQNYVRTYSVPAAVNQPPVANAGTDKTVVENDQVTLNGSGSSDPEGSLTSYQWMQISGPVVALTNPTSATASFTAPAVTQNTNLTFGLTVTDDVGQAGTDTVTVTVQPLGGGGDTTAPVTTGIFNRSVIKGKVVFAITLSANEPSTTHFRLTGLGTVSGGGSNTTAWQIYSGPVTVGLAKNGTANFDYYSDDTAGNVGATQTEVLQ